MPLSTRKNPSNQEEEESQGDKQNPLLKAIQEKEDEIRENSEDEISDGEIPLSEQEEVQDKDPVQSTPIIPTSPRKKAKSRSKSSKKLAEETKYIKMKNKVEI